MRPVRWIAAASLACLAIAWAAACATREPVVALPAVYLQRETVPLGGPLDLTLTFQIPRDLAPFRDDCRVLLRFLFDDGAVMASYDHDPPTPTRRWTAGSTITYTHRIFVPDLPYVGDVPIVVGLSSSSGERLPLAGEERGRRTYHVATVNLNARRILLVHGDGWHRPEVAADGSRWRWTESAATMTFHNPRRDAVLRLRLDGSPDRFPAPQRVSLVVADRTVLTFDVPSAVIEREVPLSAADLGDAREVTLTIKVDKTFVPAHAGQPGDTRELGVRVYNVFLEPRAAP